MTETSSTKETGLPVPQEESGERGWGHFLGGS